MTTAALVLPMLSLRPLQALHPDTRTIFRLTQGPHPQPFPGRTSVAGSGVKPAFTNSSTPLGYSQLASEVCCTKS